MRLALLLPLLWLSACSPSPQAPSTPAGPASTAAAPTAPATPAAPDAPAAPAVEIKDGRLQVSEEHRRCTSEYDCAGVYATCGTCAGDCSGVRSEFAGIYADARAKMCAKAERSTCDYDCLPRAGKEKVACVDGRCKMEKEP